MACPLCTAVCITTAQTCFWGPGKQLTASMDMQTPDNSMATSSHPPMSASIVASVTPQSTSPTATSSERGGSDSGGAAPNGAGNAHARPGLAPARRSAEQPGGPMPTDHAMGAEDPIRCAAAPFATYFS